MAGRNLVEPDNLGLTGVLTAGIMGATLLTELVNNYCLN